MALAFRQHAVQSFAMFTQSSAPSNDSLSGLGVGLTLSSAGLSQLSWWLVEAKRAGEGQREASSPDAYPKAQLSLTTS
jgi:hypothetical protein